MMSKFCGLTGKKILNNCKTNMLGDKEIDIKKSTWLVVQREIELFYGQKMQILELVSDRNEVRFISL